MVAPRGLDVREEIGLFWPELISRGLSARDRLTYYIALLQAAQVYAQAPHPPAPTLRSEREASGILDSALDQIIAASRLVGTDVVRIPGAGVVLEHIFADLREMLLPLRAAATTRADLRDRLEIYERRFEHQNAAAPTCPDDQVTLSAMDALARRTQNGHDSVQQLAMDLYWELNHLSSVMTPETINGALAYDLAAADRPAVHAFMHGINTTKPLKLERPGLDTSITRDDDGLRIQCALGVRNTHQFILHVKDLTATVTYVDRHRGRLRFFQDILVPCAIQWDPTTPNAGRVNGRHVAPTQDDLERFLSGVGSRLVFLVDWNRARKRLGQFVKNADAVALLKWAAESDIGHHAFLQAGDARIIYTALERTVPPQVRFGARLDELLGQGGARLFLMSVLRIVSAGLTGGRSARLIEDEIEAELLTHLRTTDVTVLSAAVDHATILSSMADQVAHALSVTLRGEGGDQVKALPEAVNALEGRADEIVRRSSRLLDQAGDGHQLRHLLSEADDAADLLEEVAFLLGLVSTRIEHGTAALLQQLGDLVSSGAREYLRSVEEARDMARTPARAAVERFLVAVDQLAAFRKQASTAERAIRASLLGRTVDCRELYLSASIARGLESAAHAFARCSISVRDFVLTTTSGVPGAA